MLDSYIASLAIGLMNFDAGMKEEMAIFIARIAIYSVVIYVIYSILIFAGKFTKQIQVVNTIKQKAIASGSVLFFIVAVGDLYSYKNEFMQILGIFKPSMIQMFLRRLDRLAITFILLVILFVALAFLIYMMIGAGASALDLILNNISYNGILKGMFLSIYEVFSGFVWLCFILCVISFGVAIILLPIMLCVADLSTDRYYYYDDDDYY